MNSSKQLIKSMLAKCYPSTLFRLGGGRAIPVLCYHSINVLPNHESDPLLPSLFESHLQYLKQHYVVVSLREVAEYLASGRPLPKRAVVITFDDGYQDNYEVAFPLLKKYDLHATIFVVTGFINGELALNPEPGWGAMTWEQVRDMDASPYAEIGAHTDTHQILSSLDDSAVINEVQKSKAMLQNELGRDVDLFAYPNGQGADIPPVAIREVKNLGFLGACSTFWRTTQHPNQRFLINRVMISSQDDIQTFAHKLAGRYDYLYFVHKINAIINRVIFKKGIWR